MTTCAALIGTYGLRTYINDNNSLYITDISPFQETHYRVHFHFDPNTITMATNDAHTIFYALDWGGTVIERIEFGKPSTGYQVRVGTINDPGTWTTTSWYGISDAPHYLETDWQAAPNGMAHNGVFTFWVPSTQKATYTTLDWWIESDSPTKQTQF